MTVQSKKVGDGANGHVRWSQNMFNRQKLIFSTSNYFNFTAFLRALSLSLSIARTFTIIFMLKKTCRQFWNGNVFRFTLKWLLVTWRLIAGSLYLSFLFPFFSLHFSSHLSIWVSRHPLLICEHIFSRRENLRLFPFYCVSQGFCTTSAAHLLEFDCLFCLTLFSDYVEYGHKFQMI